MESAGHLKVSKANAKIRRFRDKMNHKILEVTCLGDNCILISPNRRILKSKSIVLKYNEI